MKSVKPVAVSLDCSKLLGFSQTGIRTIRAGKGAVALRHLAGLGAKVGVVKPSPLIRGR